MTTYRNDSDLVYATGTTFTINENASEGINSSRAAAAVQINHVPVGVNDTYTLAKDSSITANLADNDTPSADGGNVWSIRSNPNHGTVDISDDGTFTYTPEDGYEGSDKFTYYIKDANGSRVAVRVDLTVDQTDGNQTNDVPVGINDTYTLAKDSSITANLADNDTPSADGGNVWSIRSNPNHGTVDISDDGTFTYTPEDGYEGSDKFTYYIKDADGSRDAVRVDLTVDPALEPIDNVSIEGLDIHLSEEGLTAKGGFPDESDNGDTSNNANDTTNDAVTSGTVVVNNATSVVFNSNQASTIGETTVVWEGKNTSTITAYKDNNGDGVKDADDTVEILTATIDNNGNYSVELKDSIDHPLNNQEDTVDVNLAVKASNGTSSDTANLAVTIEDDRSVVNNDNVELALDGKPITTNIMLILDNSKDMDLDRYDAPSGASPSKLDLVQAYFKQLVDTYDELGTSTDDVKVQIVSFSNQANIASNTWMSVSEAKEALNNLSSSDSNDRYYDTALSAAVDAYDSDGKIENATNNVSYFISDSVSANGHEIDSGKETLWTNFVKDNNIDSHAFTTRTTVAESVDSIAYDGRDAGTDADGINISNIYEIDDFILRTLPKDNINEGNLAESFGAEGGHVNSITVDGISYSFVEAVAPSPFGTIDTSANSDNYQFTNYLSTIKINTNSDGLLELNFATGDYKYLTTATRSVNEELIFSLIDNDGDIVEGEKTIAIDISGGATGEDEIPSIDSASVRISEEGLIQNNANPDELDYEETDTGELDTTNVVSVTGAMTVENVSSVVFDSTQSDTIGDTNVVWEGQGTGSLKAYRDDDSNNVKDSNQEILTATIDNSGNYSVELNDRVDHLLNNQEDLVTVDLNVKADDNNSSTDVATATLAVTIEDDRPVIDTNDATPIPTDTGGDTDTDGTTDTVSSKSNVMIILDDSRSQSTSKASGMQNVKEHLIALVDEYDALDTGDNVRVQLVTFNKTANIENNIWMTASEAKSVINSLGVASSYDSNYDDALAKAIDAYGTAGKFEDASNNESYFLTGQKADSGNGSSSSLTGSANSSSSDKGIQSAEGDVWNNFLGTNSIDSHVFVWADTSSSKFSEIASDVKLGRYAKGMESYLLGTVPDADTGNNTNPDTTPDSTISGYTGTLVNSFGADGGHVYSVTLEGKAYVYDPDAKTITKDGSNYLTDSSTMTVTLESGSTFTVDFESGEYVYVQSGVSVNGLSMLIDNEILSMSARSSSGSDESGSDESGSDESGSDESGSDESGSDESGSDESGSDGGSSDGGSGDGGTGDGGTGDGGTGDGGTGDGGTGDGTTLTDLTISYILEDNDGDRVAGEKTLQVSGSTGNGTGSNESITKDGASITLVEDDINVQTFNFGAENAGKIVTVSFDATESRKWDGMDEKKESKRDVFEVEINDVEVMTTHDPKSETHSYSATVEANGDVKVLLRTYADSEKETVTVDDYTVTLPATSARVANSLMLEDSDTDYLIGNDGDNDILNTLMDNVLTGGLGDDTFVWMNDTVLDSSNVQHDVITDFGNGNDTLDISDLLMDVQQDNLSDYLAVNGSELYIKTDVSDSTVSNTDYDLHITLMDYTIDLDAMITSHQLII